MTTIQNICDNRELFISELEENIAANLKGCNSAILEKFLSTLADPQWLNQNPSLYDKIVKVIPADCSDAVLKKFLEIIYPHCEKADNIFFVEFLYLNNPELTMKILQSDIEESQLKEVEITQQEIILHLLDKALTHSKNELTASLLSKAFTLADDKLIAKVLVNVINYGNKESLLKLFELFDQNNTDIKQAIGNNGTKILQYCVTKDDAAFFDLLLLLFKERHIYLHNLLPINVKLDIILDTINRPAHFAVLFKNFSPYHKTILGGELIYKLLARDSLIEIEHFRDVLALMDQSNVLISKCIFITVDKDNKTSLDYACLKGYYHHTKALLEYMEDCDLKILLLKKGREFRKSTYQYCNWIHPDSGCANLIRGHLLRLFGGKDLIGKHAGTHYEIL